MTALPLLLASVSPRRAQLLREAGIAFEVAPRSDVDETPPAGLAPSDVAQVLAERKARTAARRHPGRTVLAADTIVHLDGTILGKPRDEVDAREMLRRLSGRSHDVATGVAVARDALLLSGVATTRVSFRALDPAEISAYVASGEPLDKAGAYGVQGGAAAFLAAPLEGRRDTVVGLPLDLVRRLLALLAAGGAEALGSGGTDGR